MSNDQKIIKNKVGLLKLAETLRKAIVSSTSRKLTQKAKAKHCRWL